MVQTKNTILCASSERKRVYKILRNVDDLRDAETSTLLNFKRQKYDVNGKRRAEKGAQCVQMFDKFLLESKMIVLLYVSFRWQTYLTAT